MNAVLDAMRFAPEHNTLDEMMQRFGLEPILSNFEQSGGLSSMRDVVLGSNLKLSKMLSPRVFNLLADVRQRLDYQEPVDVFVSADASINAAAIYSLDETPHMIVLTSSLLERVNDDELRFVLGHEIGHIHFRHYRLRLLPHAVGKDSDGDSKMPGLLRRKMDLWNRLAELSADRAGFAAAGGNLEAVVSVFFKIASGLGPEQLRFDIEAFLQQLAELQQLEGRESICGFSHPVTPIRVRALQLFSQGGGTAIVPEQLKKLDIEVTELTKLMDYAPTKPIERHGRDFLISGGLLVGHSDEGGFSEDESKMLVEMLLPITADPEASISQVQSVAKAKEMLISSAAWLKENAGEERFTVYRYLAMIAAADGTLHPGEESFLNEVAGLLGIPAAVARKESYEILARSLQTHQAEKMKMPGMQLSA